MIKCTLFHSEPVILVLQINKKLNELNSTFDNAFLFSIGKSSEGRDMMALNVSTMKFLFFLCISIKINVHEPI